MYALFFQLSEIIFACSIEPAKILTSKMVLLSSIILHFIVYACSFSGIYSVTIEFSSRIFGVSFFSIVSTFSFFNPGNKSIVKSKED